jgi:hypothetical protein
MSSNHDDPHQGFAATVAVTAALGVVVLAILVALLVAGPAAGGPGAACQEWTDGCIVCARTERGTACSTPGIACTRGPIECLKP